MSGTDGLSNVNYIQTKEHGNVAAFFLTDLPAFVFAYLVSDHGLVQG